MRIYLDTEFIERGHQFPIELISIGLVREDGLEFYAVAEDGWDLGHCGPWLRANVLPHLGDERAPRAWIREQVLAFCGEKPEFWGYYADYDWVVLCQLFGSMVDLPKGWPMFCRDVIQLCKQMGNPQLPKQEQGAHHAGTDASHIKAMHEFLMARGAEEGPKR